MGHKENHRPLDSFLVWVTTQGKYNSGSNIGTWLALDNFYDKEDFLEACASYHSDDEDPEFLFVDYPNLGSLMGETHIDDRLWDILSLDHFSQKILWAFAEGSSAQEFSCLENREILEKCQGVHDSDADFAEWYYEEICPMAVESAHDTGLVIDWEATWLRTLSDKFYCIEYGPRQFYYFEV